MQLLWEEVPRTYTAQVWNCHGCKHDLFHRFICCILNGWIVTDSVGLVVKKHNK